MQIASVDNRHCWVRVLVTTALSLCSMQSSALTFFPTEAEWQAWPEYCRARYLVSSSGPDSGFAGRLPDYEIQRWQASMGEAWYALHHYCAALTKVDRGTKELSKEFRDSRYADAIGEYIFFMERTPPTHPLYAESAARICLAKDSMGKTEYALKHCDLAIHAQPSNPAGYAAKATVYRRSKKFAEALDVLKLGNDETQGQSAELQYFLGLTYVDLRDYPRAAEHARSAYALGYPLPGLRNRLKAAGYDL